jgi:hypothetical protein
MIYRQWQWVLAVVVGLAAAGNIEAGVSYQDPAGGWKYTYQGTFNAGVADAGCAGGVCPAGFGASNQTGALDGTWQHSQSSKWDGSAPGVFSVPNNNPSVIGNNNGTSPGGAAALTESGTNFIRVQDTGNPETFGYVQVNPRPINSNRRIYFGHSIVDDFGVNEPPPVNGRDWERVLDNGVTISFRMRIPNTAPLDNVYTDVGGTPTNLPWYISPDADYGNNGYVDDPDYVLWRKGVQPLPANEVDNVGTTNAQDYTEWRNRFGNERLGRGYAVHDDGRAMITIMQNNGDENDPFYGVDGTVAFSLLTSKDIQGACAGAPTATICSGSGSGGLMMNNLSGDSPNNSIDFLDTGQTLNLLPIADQALKNWHEFWITISDNGGTTGTHDVKVYMDGSTTPTTFHVTASGSNNGAYANFNAAFLEFGLSSTGLFGAFDMDFLSYQLGVITPVAAGAGAGANAVPEPASLTLFIAAMTWLGLGARRLPNQAAHRGKS